MPPSEVRINAAIQAYQSGQFKSLSASAKRFNCSVATVMRRFHGRPPKANSTSYNRKLSDTEELILVEWIVDNNTRGISVTKAMLVQKAELLLLQHEPNASRSTPRIGVNWPSNFIKRHPDLRMKYNRKYDYQRALCEDPQLLYNWFQLVRNTIDKWGIQQEDIYNFDETGFQMGVISTTKVITSIHKVRTKPMAIQPGNREWVTAIEAISATGQVLPPMVIFKGKMRQLAWYKEIPRDWTIEVSDNGWTTDQLGYFWLSTVFNKHSSVSQVGRYRLLILDGHGSHQTVQFDQYCKDHHIIVLCMPPHSSHLLQPLDVGCFALLKRNYGQGVAELIRTGIDHVDKLDFLTIYNSARSSIFTPLHIQSAFAATGLAPYDPERVICKLQLENRPITPPSQLPTQLQPTSETPRTIIQLQSQIELINTLIHPRISGSTSPTLQAVKSLVKGCQMAMHSAILLAAENTKLQAANKKVRKKQLQKREYVPRNILSTPIEVLQDRGVEVIEATSQREEIRSIQDPPPQRATRLCSICRMASHTARTCPDRIAIY
jgi:DDE superfamily endonuclease/Tc5 transposase DNA-binding domain